MGRVWRITAVLVLFALGTSLITPLIPLYKADLGFNDTVVTLFLVCYVVALVPSMLTLGQTSDRVGRKVIVLGAIGTLAIAQALLVTEPPLWGLLLARAIQGLATGAFFGTCTAFLVDSAPMGRQQLSSSLAATAVRLGLGLGPGLGGVIAQYAAEPLRLPFEIHLAALALAVVIVLTLPETVTVRDRRPLSLRLGVPRAERDVFWLVLVPSGMLFSLFDGVALSLIPVFLVEDIGVTNYVLVGASGFLVLVAGAISPLVLRRVSPRRAIAWGLLVAAVSSVGVVAGSPIESVALVLASVAVTGAAAGMVFKGGVGLCALIAPVEDRGKLLSSYYVACYLGGFSVPLVVLGVLGDLVGLTAALAVLSAAGAAGAAWTGLIGMRSLGALRPGDDALAAAPAPPGRSPRVG